MRCLIIGTSNSILRSGYRPHLEALCPEIAFQFFLVGASPSVLLPYALLQQPVDGVDCVIIDTLVNDANHVAAGSADEGWCALMVREAALHLQSLGKRVVLLLMPQTVSPTLADRMRRSRIALAQAHALEVEDGYDVVRAMREQCGLDDDAMYRDSSHAGPVAALLIAQRLARRLRAASAAARPRSVAAYPYAFRPFAEAQVERATGLLSRRYTRLSEGQSQVFAFDEAVAVVGLSLNGAATSCFLTITGEGESTVKDLRFDQEGDGARAMQHQLVAFSAPPVGTRFEVAVTLRGGAEPVEPTRRARSAIDEGTAELGGLIVRVVRPGETLASLAVAPRPAIAAPSPPDLSPEEAAIARLAALLPSPGRVQRARRVFRDRIAKPRPVWERQIEQVAIPLALLGVELEEAKVSAEILTQALAAAPESRLIRGTLSKLRGAPTA